MSVFKNWPADAVAHATDANGLGFYYTVVPRLGNCSLNWVHTAPDSFCWRSMIDQAGPYKDWQFSLIVRNPILRDEVDGFAEHPSTQDQQVNHESAMLGVEAGEAGKQVYFLDISERQAAILMAAWKMNSTYGKFGKVPPSYVRPKDAKQVGEELHRAFERHGHTQEQFDQVMSDRRAEFEQSSIPVASGALSTQEGGSHYKDLAIQPVEYVHANKLDFLQGSVVKYVTRHKTKNGLQDIKKAIHFLQLIAELDYGVNLLEDDVKPVCAEMPPKATGQVHDMDALISIVVKVREQLGHLAAGDILHRCGYTKLCNVPDHDIDRVYSVAFNLLVAEGKQP